MRIKCTSIGDDNLQACPLIQNNYIEASTHNGILCSGLNCRPLVRANIIQHNRKAGIKLQNKASADIGGHGLDDLNINRKKILNKLDHS